jgi:hypothetical protein
LVSKRLDSNLRKNLDGTGNPPSDLLTDAAPGLHKTMQTVLLITGSVVYVSASEG